MSAILVRARRFTTFPAQADVVELVVAGLTDKQIAARLGVSYRTVRSHLERLYARTGERSRARVAVLWALSPAGARRLGLTCSALDPNPIDSTKPEQRTERKESPYAT